MVSSTTPNAAGAQTGPIRVGLIGYGFVGKTFHAPLIRATKGLVLAAVASSDAQKVRADLGEVVVFDDPLKLIASDAVDLVIIATPNETHVPFAEAAIAAGRHVVVDKPFTPTMADARRLIAQAADGAVMLAVFHNRRWDSDFLAVRTMIASGRLGRVVHFESHIDRYRPAVRNRWRERALPASGVWFDLGPHLVDQTLQLFGLPDTILASLAMQREGAQVDDWAHVVLSYGRLRVVLHCSMLALHSPRFVVHGTSATALKREPDQQESQLLAGVIPGTSEWGEDADPLILIDPAGERSEHPASGDQRAFYAGVVEHLAGRAPNPVPGAQALAVCAVIEAAVRSAASGRATSVDLTDAEREAWLASIVRC